jgi:uncharacterized membrane protein YwaF
MKWGTFGPVHILSLLVGAGLLVGLYFILKNRSQRVQILVLGILSFAGISSDIYNMLAWGSPLEYLPLHLCSLNALLLPIAVFTRSKILSNLLLVWSLGAAAALLLNQAAAEATLFSIPFCTYYFAHLADLGIPILLFKLHLTKKDPRCILSTIGITMGVYTLIHFLNLGLNALFAQNGIMSGDALLQVNYMYSLAQENPLLQVFYSIIPAPYWYMYMIVPILVVYLLIVYAPQLLAKKRENMPSPRKN